MTTLNHIETSTPLADVRQLIGASRQCVALAVNAELTQLYWQIGNRVNVELLQGNSMLSAVWRKLIWSKPPSRELLQAKLHQSIEIARAKIQTKDTQ